VLEVKVYLSAGGKAPFLDWLEGLQDRQARAKVRTRIDRLRLGNFGDCRSVGSGVSELRIDFGPGYRVYFGKDGARVVILLAGGDKKSQARDILKAKRSWLEYQEMKHV